MEIRSNLKSKKIEYLSKRVSSINLSSRVKVFLIPERHVYNYDGLLLENDDMLLLENNDPLILD